MKKIFIAFIMASLTLTGIKPIFADNNIKSLDVSVDAELLKILDTAINEQSEAKNINPFIGFSIASIGAAGMGLSYYFYKKLKEIDPKTTDPELIKKRDHLIALAWICGIGGSACFVGGGAYGIATIGDGEQEPEIPTPLNESGLDDMHKFSTQIENIDDQLKELNTKENLTAEENVLKKQLKKEKKQLRKQQVKDEIAAAKQKEKEEQERIKEEQEKKAQQIPRRSI